MPRKKKEVVDVEEVLKKTLKKALEESRSSGMTKINNEIMSKEAEKND